MTLDLPTPAQIRGARGLLDWSILDLARAAGVSVMVVKRLERGYLVASADQVGNLIRDALETRGVVFLADGPRTGVLLRDR